jgi:hypothetical protein
MRQIQIRHKESLQIGGDASRLNKTYHAQFAT